MWNPGRPGLDSATVNGRACPCRHADPMFMPSYYRNKDIVGLVLKLGNADMLCVPHAITSSTYTFSL